MRDWTHTRPDPQLHRALFLSDLHLGAPGAQPEKILAFLRLNPALRYYLVGDILDLWHPEMPLWTAACQEVIDHLHARQADGAEVIYVAGNHDPSLLAVPQGLRPPAPAQNRAYHITARGARLLVIHGDQADNRLLRNHFMTRLGAQLDRALRLAERRLRGSQQWVEALRQGINAALYRKNSHERRLVGLARAERCDGVVCGHFHIPALHRDHGLLYANCGDFVDTFSALAEDHTGELHQLDLATEVDALPVFSQQWAYS